MPNVSIEVFYNYLYITANLDFAVIHNDDTKACSCWFSRYILTYFKRYELDEFTMNELHI